MLPHLFTISLLFVIYTPASYPNFTITKFDITISQPLNTHCCKVTRISDFAEALVLGKLQWLDLAKAYYSLPEMIYFTIYAGQPQMHEFRHIPAILLPFHNFFYFFVRAAHCDFCAKRKKYLLS